MPFKSWLSYHLGERAYGCYNSRHFVKVCLQWFPRAFVLKPLSSTGGAIDQKQDNRETQPTGKKLGYLGAYHWTGMLGLWPLLSLSLCFSTANHFQHDASSSTGPRAMWPDDCGLTLWNQKSITTFSLYNWIFSIFVTTMESQDHVYWINNRSTVFFFRESQVCKTAYLQILILPV